MLDITKDNFEKEITNSEKLALVDFWAPWCMPCKIITPTLEEIAKELKDDLKVCKINVDNNPDIATEMSVLNIPTLILFKNGKEVSRIIGVNSKDAIESKIKTFLD